MSAKKPKPRKKEKAKAAASAPRQSAAAADRKPPETAENFEHVLRRLVSARDRQPHGG